jgi:hypothetical protein
MLITHLHYEAFSSQMPLIRKKTTSKASWSQEQLKTALAAVGNVRKIREIGRQLGIYEATLRQRLKRNMCDHMLQLSDMFYGDFLLNCM